MGELGGGGGSVAGNGVAPVSSARLAGNELPHISSLSKTRARKVFF